MGTTAIRLVLCGDVMLGRGVDQILAHPGDPTLHERIVRDARQYVELAERMNGEVPRGVEPSYPWGVVLPLLRDLDPDVLLLNLETAVTTSDVFEVGKAVHYRMHPANLAAVQVVEPDVCVLANNHVLDFGAAGLAETLDVLADVRVPAVGAGRDRPEAWRPAVVPVSADSRVLVSAWGVADSGIPPWWMSTEDRPGVAYLAEPSAAAAELVLETLRLHRRAGDLTVVSLHWGSNWGFDVPNQHVRFAHALVDGGVDVVYGHSAHHPRPVEVYRDRLILYGCGDLIDDYEGIGGHTAYRPELRLLYVVQVERDTGRLEALELVPLRARRLMLEHASADGTAWFGDVLNTSSRVFGSAFERSADGRLRLVV